jgi:hypothetical protein
MQSIARNHHRDVSLFHLRNLSIRYYNANAFILYASYDFISRKAGDEVKP